MPSGALHRRACPVRGYRPGFYETTRPPIAGAADQPFIHKVWHERDGTMASAGASGGGAVASSR